MIGFRYLILKTQLAITGIDSNLWHGNTEFSVLQFHVRFANRGRIERTWEQLQFFTVGKAGLYANNRSYRIDDIVVPSVGFLHQISI